MTEAMRKLILLFSISLLCQTCLARGDVRVVSAYLFANTVFEVHDNEGRSIRLDPPLMEYRRITRWDSSEVSVSPMMVDVIAVIDSDVADTEVTVDMALYEKVGPLIIDERYGVTDIDRGAKSARWRGKASLTKSIKVARIGADETISIVFGDISLKEIIDRRYSIDEWPYRLKVVVSVSCIYCSSDDVTEVLVINPGD